MIRSDWGNNCIYLPRSEMRLDNFPMIWSYKRFMQLSKLSFGYRLRDLNTRNQERTRKMKFKLNSIGCTP
jgi:hypothetical protein